MKIAVLVKLTADASLSEIKTNENNNALKEELGVNPFDLYALEQALLVKSQIEKEGRERAEVFSLTLSSETFKNKARDCLAFGADRAVLIKDDEECFAEFLETGKLLAKVLENEKPDLIFCGARAIDRASALTPIIVADILKIPFVANIKNFQLDSGQKIAKTINAEGAQEFIYQTRLPAIFSCEKGLNNPRYPSLPGIMAAKKKTLKIINPADLLVLPKSGGLNKFIRPPKRKGAGALKNLSKDEAAEKILSVVKKIIFSEVDRTDKNEGTKKNGIEKYLIVEKDEKSRVILGLNLFKTKRILSRVSITNSSPLYFASKAEFQKDKIILERNFYAGKIINHLELQWQSMAVIFDSGQYNFSLSDANLKTKEAENIEDKSFADERSVLVKIKESTADEVDLNDAKIVVCAGRGIGSKENIALAKKLAKKLGAALGGSRATIDSGWLDHKYQIGQTGKTVKPEVYLGFGVSGAVQHQAGMNKSKYIIAVNINSEAPIFEIADLGIVGDLFEIIPVLTDKF